jgi:hypothetical protein
VSHKHNRPAFAPVSFAFGHKENAAAWENDPCIIPYGNQGTCPELPGYIRGNWVGEEYYFAAL